MIVLFMIAEETEERYVSMLCGYIKVDRGINISINFGMSLGIKNHNNLVQGFTNTQDHNIHVGLYTCYIPTYNKPNWFFHLQYYDSYLGFKVFFGVSQGPGITFDTRSFNLYE